MTLPQSVLFVCDRNTIRSPMAEGLLARRFAARVFAHSCGVCAGRETDAFAIAVMDELGVDISRHRPRGLDDLKDLSFDLIVALSPEAHHCGLRLTRARAVEVEYWPTYDPSAAEGAREQRLTEYRAVREALDERIARRFAIYGTALA